MSSLGPLATVQMRPIGVFRTPFADRVSAPRQPQASEGARGTIELLPDQNFEHALEDLTTFSHVWVLFWFHLNEGWRPKVLPPRSEKRRGVFATRSPHRPNPIGLSVVELEGVSGLTLSVRHVDAIDGTPVLDIKPYVPYADIVGSAATGWLDPRDPKPAFDVVWSDLATEQACWLRETHAVDLVSPATQVLALGPAPHPYRRIRKQGDGFRLAVKDWRVDFRVSGTTVVVDAIVTGYRERDLATSRDAAVDIHRAFLSVFSSNLG
ncbi:MAG TPA: tRNA (N6-threonylcarbamoyladenosine(37)-N6)-methyltransferase TrmO [Polyangiaceae bacterium]|nr:tRNA (N6-threonylcarbamoyladenosine(37)-N6)-methyltransferase TrmO [Polyangiaceae bacterium]